MTQRTPVSTETPTPRTLARWNEEWKMHDKSGGRSSPAHGMSDFAEELERELAAANAALAAARELLLRIRSSINTNGELSVLCMQDIDAFVARSVPQGAK